MTVTYYDDNDDDDDDDDVIDDNDNVDDSDDFVIRLSARELSQKEAQRNTIALLHFSLKNNQP